MAHEAEPVTIFHNPNCGTSRKVLAAIEAQGIAPQVVRYLHVGWTRGQLNRLLDALALKPADLLRAREGAAAELREKDDETILAAMVRDGLLTGSVRWNARPMFR